MDRVKFSENHAKGGSFLQLSLLGGVFGQRKTREVLRPPALSLKGKSLGLQVDLDREGLLLSVLFVVLVLVAAFATWAGVGENRTDGESSDERCEE